MSSTVFTVAFGMLVAIIGFFTKSSIEDVRAVAGDFRIHQQESARLVAEFRGIDMLHDQRVNALEKKVDEANHKLDLILDKVMR